MGAEMSEKLTTIEKEVRALKEKKQSKQEEWNRIVEEKEKLKSVEGDVQLIDSITREIEVLEEKRDDLQIACPMLDGDRGLDTVKREEKEASAKLRVKRK